MLKMNKPDRFILLSSVICLLSSVFLCGCATTYNFVPGGKKYSNGYVVERNDVVIPEFTVDKLGKAPQDLLIAKARFKRRHAMIIHYYRKMGYFGSQVTDDAKVFLGAFTVPVRTPIEAVNYNKYKNDPAYRAKIDAQDELEEKKEQERIMAIEEEIKNYINKDMELEESNKASVQEDSPAPQPISESAPVEKSANISK